MSNSGKAPSKTADPTTAPTAPPTAPSTSSSSTTTLTSAPTAPVGIKKFFGPATKPLRARPSLSSPPPTPLVAAKRPAEDMEQPSLNPKSTKKANITAETENDGLGDSNMNDGTNLVPTRNGEGTLPPDAKDKLAKVSIRAITRI